MGHQYPAKGRDLPQVTPQAAAARNVSSSLASHTVCFPVSHSPPVPLITLSLLMNRATWMIHSQSLCSGTLWWFQLSFSLVPRLPPCFYLSLAHECRLIWTVIRNVKGKEGRKKRGREVRREKAKQNHHQESAMTGKKSSDFGPQQNWASCLQHPLV